MPYAGETPLRFTPARLSRSSRSRYRIVIARGDDIKAFEVRPRYVWAVGLLSILFGALYFTATGYLVFRDDLLAASLAHQARVQQAYEDRIASLRSDIDRLTSRQLLNQEAFEARLEDLLGRQAALDARQDIIASLSDVARSAGLAGKAAAKGTPLPRPRPTTDARLDTITTGSLQPAGEPPRLAGVALRGATTDALPETEETHRILAAETSLDTIAREQVEFVEGVATVVAERATKIATVLENLGHKTGFAADDSAMGGPFVPLDEDSDPEDFRVNVEAVAAQIEQFASLRDRASRLPLARPVAGAPMTSGFGTRLDPFLKRPAMHAGIDFRLGQGSPVKVTAAGTVISAGYSGGYGNMVEVDHGGGIVTRYAHLSKTLVRKGARVSAGDVIGNSGSTGRSTGPHLHYEVRVGGRAIDPMRYIRAGQELMPLL